MNFFYSIVCYTRIHMCVYIYIKLNLEMGEFTFGCKLKFLVFFSVKVSTPKLFSSQLPEGRFPATFVHSLTLTHVHVFVQ
jgi:hypothetical protein